MEQTRVKDIPGIKMCKFLVVTVESGTFVLIIIFTQSPYDAYAYDEHSRTALNATISEDNLERNAVVTAIHACYDPTNV